MPYRPIMPGAFRAPSGAREAGPQPVRAVRCWECFMRFLDATKTGLCQQCMAERLAGLGVTIKTEDELIFPECHFTPWGPPTTMEETVDQIPWWAVAAFWPPWWARMSRYAIKPRDLGRREWMKIILILAHGRGTRTHVATMTESH